MNLVEFKQDVYNICFRDNFHYDFLNPLQKMLSCLSIISKCTVYCKDSFLKLLCNSIQFNVYVFYFICKRFSVPIPEKSLTYRGLGEGKVPRTNQRNWTHLFLLFSTSIIHNSKLTNINYKRDYIFFTKYNYPLYIIKKKLHQKKLMFLSLQKFKKCRKRETERNKTYLRRKQHDTIILT